MYVSHGALTDCKTSGTDSHRERSYDLPDGRQITLGTERHMAPETLFRPPAKGSEPPKHAKANLRQILYNIRQ